ncbi:flagellar basal body-associated protein FliL [Sulfurimonas sp. SAG-AH-194-I05]|nr:flagellar basal body-associated protein FliL [Sulfurimonas sp. SAG-AH-194-I05]MDF1874684.1 flagellar basal body-associated protein FliL [Sulfurimonas sp. SAG-AH-194-I05]
MADEENKESEEAPAEKKSSNMLLIIIIVVLVLLILLGAVAALLMGGDDEEEMQAPQKMEQPKEKSSARSRRSSASMTPMDDNRQLSEIGILYPMDTFTVNLKSDAGRRYLKATMSLELEGEELSLELDAKTAVLRDRIIRILSSKTLEEISSKKGKAKVSSQIMGTLNAMIADGEIQGIYFTEFVIQ